MKAAIEKALTNVSHPGKQDCIESMGENQWRAKISEFRRKRFVFIFRYWRPAHVGSTFTAVCLSTHRTVKYN